MRTGMCIALCLGLGVATAGCGDDSGGTNANHNENENTNVNVVECGNGSVEGLEECDDGTANSDTVPNACRADCTLPHCGDSVTDDADSEQCDDGTANSDTEPDACRTDCQEPSCGDDVIDTNHGETCDDGNNDAGDGCGPTCVLETCGDGILDSGEECDDGGANSNTQPDACRENCTTARCGDGTVDTGELCDDGNNDPGDGCSGSCLSDESCGNAILELTEECDDGNLASRDGCSSGCTLETLDWQQLTGVGAPLARCGHAMVYDRARHVVVMHGGYDPVGDVLLAETTELGVGWWGSTSLSPDIAFGRSWFDMVYDAARGVVHLFGGYNDHGTIIFPANDDNNHYDSQSWTAVTYTPNASERWGHAMVYDASRDRVVLFGGRNVMVDLPGTLETDPSSSVSAWHPITTTSQTPDERSFHAMAYDAASQVTVLQGGQYASVYRGGTWLFDGASATWSDVTPTAGSPNPGERAHHALVFDPWRQRAVLFGGDDYAGVLGDTWEWDGTNWMETTPVSSPSPRHDHAMAYDRRRRGVLLFGGNSWVADCGNTSNVALSDTWIYRYDSAWPDEVCDNATDDDSDGLLNCADPDCEGLPCATGSCSSGVCQ